MVVACLHTAMTVVSLTLLTIHVNHSTSLFLQEMQERSTPSAVSHRKPALHPCNTRQHSKVSGAPASITEHDASTQGSIHSIQRLPAQTWICSLQSLQEITSLADQLHKDHNVAGSQSGIMHWDKVGFLSSLLKATAGCSCFQPSLHDGIPSHSLMWSWDAWHHMLHSLCRSWAPGFS